ncbi:MAG: DUF2752 domain-containing protein [Acinetobacter sp.]|nr:MAG: DUF2752 domain-containing protein [Acinetobacter sp.]
MQLLLIYILSALSFVIDKADIFLIPCPFKYLTHLDCPGCGFQRSVLALIQGDFEKSCHFYPPAIPFLIGVLIGISSYSFKWDRNSKILKSAYLTVGFIILINYIFKIATHQLQ